MLINSNEHDRLARNFLESRFTKPNSRYIDFDAAAEFFGVATSTIRRWSVQGFPNMAMRIIHLASRAMPDSKEWEHFSFGRDGRLHSGYAKQSWTPGELDSTYWSKQISEDRKRECDQLNKQLVAIRNDEERSAIIAELEEAIHKLEQLKLAPWLARNGTYFHS